VIGTVKITEVASQLNVSARAIRFYEEKGLITPDKEPGNQYRLFTEEHIGQLKTIIALREIGVPVEQIKVMLEGLEQGDTAPLQDILEQHRNQLYREFLEMKQLIETADRMLERVQMEHKVDQTWLYRMAEGSKRLRDSRNAWKDRWDFDQLAAVYDEEVEQGSPAHLRPFAKEIGGKYALLLDRMVEWIAPRAREQGLDIGIGTGNLAERFLAQGAMMSGLDQSQSMLNESRRKLPNLPTRLGNWLSVPYFERTFDFVVSSFTLHHLTEEQKPLALEEMTRVLKPRGRICLVDVMFEHEGARERYRQMKEAEGDQDVLRSLHERMYADKSQLLGWLRDHGYVTMHQAYAEVLHVVYAIRASD